MDFDTLDLNQHRPFIVARILEYGDIPALRWLFKSVDKQKIKKVLMDARGFSPKTINFWRLLFNLDKDNIKCLEKSYQKTQSSHWIY